jgi:hypothetical protein
VEGVKSKRGASVWEATATGYCIRIFERDFGASQDLYRLALVLLPAAAQKRTAITVANWGAQGRINECLGKGSTCRHLYIFLVSTLVVQKSVCLPHLTCV